MITTIPTQIQEYSTTNSSANTYFNYPTSAMTPSDVYLPYCDDFTTSSNVVPTTYFEFENKIVGDIDVELRYCHAPSMSHDVEEHGIGGRIKLFSSGIGRSYGFNISQAQLLSDNIVQTLPYLKEKFVRMLQESARQAGHKIADELIRGRFPQPDKKQILKEALSECMMEIPTEGGICKVPLSDVVKRNIGEGESLTVDYEQIRLARVRHKKEIYTKKVKSITICRNLQAYRIELEDAYKFWGIQNKDFSQLSEEGTIKELKALTLLRKLVSEDQFKNYMQHQFIDVPDYRGGKVYRIHRDQRIEVLGVTKDVESRLCLHLDNPGGPKTDEFIMKVMFAKNNPEQLFIRSNKYDAHEVCFEDFTVGGI